MNLRNRVRRRALRHDVAGTIFAPAALCGYAQLELNVVKSHASARMTGDFTVRNAVADTDNHWTESF